jgi:hypothetical protein
MAPAWYVLALSLLGWGIDLVTAAPSKMAHTAVNEG